ncbi:MAG: hypothetical protein EOP86_09705, partial [Verrucomicrobiaceae bacterium]
MPAADPPPPTVLLEECLSAEDARFPELLRRVSAPKTLETLVNRWTADPRPWAREQIARYLEFPFDRPGHEVVVKRLFKHAEKQGWDEVMGAFLTAFDRMVRRGRSRQWRWDWASSSGYTEEVLKTPRNTFRGGRPHRSPITGKWEHSGSPLPRPADRLFTHRTRHYLRRRVWRYFRGLAWRDPERYIAAVYGALMRYRDEDFQKGENLLDSWSFMHACFGGSPALKFLAHRPALEEGKTLADLAPAPWFPEHWQHAFGISALTGLASGAPARTVRLWAVRWLASPEMAAAAGTLDFSELKRLLFCQDEDVEPQAVTLLERHPESARWTVPQWLALLEAPGHAVLDAVTALMRRHVRPDRLDAEACLALACARPFPVARMGFDFLKARTLTPDEVLRLVPKTATARCAALAPELTEWSLNTLNTPNALNHPSPADRSDSPPPEPGKPASRAGGLNAEQLSLYCDAPLDAIRLAAWAWLDRHRPAGVWNDPVFWSRLAETPYEDLRLKLVDTLAMRAALPGGNGQDHPVPVWTAVLLGVHRGGRQKQKAMRQIVSAISADETLAATLLSVLAVAVRS